MSSVEIRTVEHPRDTARWVKSWWPIYADDPMWVPPLIMDKKDFFHPKKNPYFKRADCQCFWAFKDGKAVGTIAATVDHDQQKNEPGLGYIGFYEFVDDLEVAQGLYDAATGWLRGKGMNRVRGPFNLSPNHDFGLLIDGFDTPPMIANPHARPYYGDMYEKVGLRKAMDWYAYWLDHAADPPDRISRINDRFMKRNPNVTIVQASKKNFEKEVKQFYEIYNDAWEDNWGHVPLSEEEFEFQAKGLKHVVDERLILWCYVDGELAGAAVTLPDYNQVFKKMNGSLFPFGWWHFLTGKKHINQIRVFVLGVKRKFQHMPLGAPMYIATWKAGSKMNITGAEASLILDNNTRMRGALEKLGGRIYKTYRVYDAEV
jgi:hypothetical protein